MTLYWLTIRGTRTLAPFRSATEAIVFAISYVLPHGVAMGDIDVEQDR